ncbi:Hcp family type VI secretion system effector [Magnetospirillum sulfuroxidans]|uniref:Type VI secretion system tube protein Hcp n=1 Tax=Magnetospirillum sulfuroxidans TaxID=611300 RepID=A0ABS5IC49_9PROT|nr:type VI secretion system tube protein Hcp [Magnetospirillum sulfuroxidans]MBR9972006.1 type VI secretion system tube protein Hcp [Magnetospirillum sulfuroxidans]
MAQNFFIKIDGIDGESQVDGHTKDIQVLSWSHSFNQPTSATRSSAGGGTVEQANHADFSFTKYVDVASVPLMKSCWNGKTIATATFTAYRSDGDSLIEYLKVEMTNVLISNISFGGGTGDMASETITLSYSKVKYTYTQQKVAGAGNDGNKAASHDLALQKVE